MVLEHIAAILLFSGPLFYLGLWMAIDPAGIASLPETVAWALKGFVRVFVGLKSSETIQAHSDISPRLRRGLRIAGIALAVVAIAA